MLDHIYRLCIFLFICIGKLKKQVRMSKKIGQKNKKNKIKLPSSPSKDRRHQISKRLIISWSFKAFKPTS